MEKTTRDATIAALVQKVAAGYVLPENADRIAQALRSANRLGEYNGKTPRDFADAVNRVDKETDAQWKQGLQQTLNDLLLRGR